MAIYHFSAQIINRSKGRSSVAAAAYRAGQRFEDERTGLSHDYTKKSGIEHTEILAPDNSPEWVNDRAKLWNEVEIAEKRKDAQTAREINVALPRELKKEQQIECVRSFVKDNFVNKGMVADIAIHSNDIENPHAHIMLTMRDITPEGFGKKNREWNDKEQLEQWREKWAEYANKALERSGHTDRIDHRSLEAQGIDREPQIHVGPHAAAMEKKGILSEKGERNREIQEINKKLDELKQEKIIVMEEYKQLKKEQIEHKKEEDKWKYFNTEEKKAVLDAKNMLGKYADMKSIHEGYKDLDEKGKSLNKILYKLNEKEMTFSNTERIVNRLEMCRDELKHSGIFSPERKPLKEEIKKLENDFKLYRFKSEQDFKNEYQELKQEIAAKREEIQGTKEDIKYHINVLKSAENALQNAEHRKLIESYPEHKKYFINFEYEHAKALNKINDVMGRPIPLENIRSMGERANDILNDIERYRKAEKYLTKYEELTEKLSKMESGLNGLKINISQKVSSEYNDTKREMQYSKINFESCRVNSREDFNAQVGKTDHEMNKLPGAIQKQGLEGLNMLSGGLKAINIFSREVEKVQTKERWEAFKLQQQQERAQSKGRGKGRHHHEEEIER